jgi:hypothetical protein
MVQASWSEVDLARARVAYETTDWSCKRISEATRVSLTTLYRYARLQGWKRCEAARGQSPALVKATRHRRSKATARRRQVLRRLWALLEQHLAGAEARARTKAGLAAGDREMRVIGGIVKTIRECELLEAARANETASVPKETPSDDPPTATRSPDEVREAFASLVSELFEGGHPPGGSDVAS